MIDLSGVTRNPAIEEITDLLCAKVQNTDRSVFRVEVAYFLAKMASNMRAVISTKDRGEIPVNLYALALATSGYGKNHSLHILENDLLNGFRHKFVNESMPTIAEKSLNSLAHEWALKNNTTIDEELERAKAEFNRVGEFTFTFDSGSTPAVKQLRHKLLMAKCGSINLQIDEIGSNLLGSVEILNTFLELYDQGVIKQKLTKNTADNKHNTDLEGRTPANALLFGTPSKLLDGGQTEDQFYSFLETGYARRCLFGFGHTDRKAFHSKTAKEIYDQLIKQENSAAILKWSTHFTKLASPTMLNWKMNVQEPVAIRLLEYKIECERAADAMADHEDIRKAELSHRYNKALKLAGALAFVDSSMEVEMDHLMQAIQLVEESGEAFGTILTREKAYVKLAKYIASVDTDVTHADLVEALPFYKSGNAARNEMMSLAMAWGYKQHIIIKKNYIEGIEFFTGETLEETDLNKMTLSYSDHFAYNYVCEPAPFDKLHMLTQADGMHWANHAFVDGHRAEEHVIPGFNMLVLDVDEGISLQSAQELMGDFKFLTYTTKRYTEEANRFRMILPINYRLELDTEDYEEFMLNILNWLPFKVDESVKQRAKKWESCATGTYHYNLEGRLVDALRFIPKTSKNEQYKKSLKKLESLGNLERWFAQRIVSGNRNNHMIRYALALVDNGMDLRQVEDQLMLLNKRVQKPLDESEIRNTIMVTVAKRLEKLHAKAA